MNTLWTFGDSFTNHNYKGIDEEIKNEIIQWPDIVSDNLNTKLQNKGIPGNSNPQIISDILFHLPKIKQNDFIVVGLTTPTRPITVRDNTIQSFMALEYHYEKNKTPQDIDQIKRERICLDYSDEILNKNKEVLSKWYKNQIKSLLLHLNKELKIQYYIFDDSYWSKFQNINQYTQGKHIDFHWSKNGHNSMGKHIIRKLTNRKQNLL